MQYLQRICLMGLVLVVSLGVNAQRKKTTTKKPTAAPVKAQTAAKETADTSAPKTVTITSAFKPFLKNAAKMNFTAATPVIDSSRIPVTYQVPSQNLFFSYQPVPIKPLALAVDSGYAWENHQYIKVGAGNFSSYVAEAAFSFGDGRNSVTNIKGNFLTSTGHRHLQQASRWGIDALTMFNGGQDDEWTAHAFYNTQTQYVYGYQLFGTIPYTKGLQLRQFNTVGIDLGMRTKVANSFGITYHPQISFVRISDNHEANGYDFVIKAPIRKSFGTIYSFNLGLTADMSGASMPQTPNPLKITNNLYYLNPSIQFKTPNVKINAGIQPSWDNKQFSMLPDITAEAKLSESGLVFEAGWTGYFQKNTYRSLVVFNPWIDNITGLKNTRIREQYVGVKGTTGNHFTFQGRFSLVNLDNQPLFVNSNTGDGGRFLVSYEPSMKAVRIHGELGYTVQEKFSFVSGVTFNQYNSLSVNEKPWGLLPVEITGSARWRPLKDLILKADLFAWDGAAYRDISAQTRKADPAADLNFGAEFTVIPKLNLWIQMNNLLNTTYQRWNQYTVLGFNVVGGIVYSFK